MPRHGSLSSEGGASVHEEGPANALFRGEIAPGRGSPPSAPSGVRRYDYRDTQMCNPGISDAAPSRQGRGRRTFNEEDHLSTRDGHLSAVDGCSFEGFFGAAPPQHVRRSFHHTDNVRDEVFQAQQGVGSDKPIDATEGLKEAVRDCLAQDQGIEVYDEDKWAQAAIGQNGCVWKLEALSEQGRCICREGRSARGIADKLSMLGGQELKHFGVRFAGKSRSVGASDARAAARGAAPNGSPTQLSPGVQTVLGTPRQKQGDPQLSCARKDPSDQMRRYIASGKDHFATSQVGSHGDPGAYGDMGFCDGLARGIGHGRRQVSTARQAQMSASVFR